MNVDRIAQLISQGEGLTVEFKKAKNALPESLFETICAFLNRNGGVILLGIADDGTVEGIDPAKAPKMLKELANLSNNPQKLFPAFLLNAETVEFHGKILIYLYVPASSQVYRCKSKVYDRSEDGDFELKTDEQIKNCYIRKNNSYSENTIYPFLNETDFEPGIIERVRRIIQLNRRDHPWNDLSDMDFFRMAGLYRKDYVTEKEGFTMAALLLFGKEEAIQSAIPHYKVDALLRKIDTDRYDDRENIRCNLVLTYDKLMAFVAKHLPDKFYLQGDQRISLRDKIFREIVANMLIHREYTNAYPSTFIIYKHKVETRNANRPHLYGQLLPETFVPFPKNPHIAQIFTQMGRSEELGTGLRNVYKYSKAYSGSEDLLFNEEDVFTVDVPLDNETESDRNVVGNIPNYGEKIDNSIGNELENELETSLVERERQIIQRVKKNSYITQKELGKIIGITPQNIRVYISKLKQKGLLVRVGPAKGGHWEITNKTGETKPAMSEKSNK